MIIGAIEVISFDDTHGEMESVIESNLIGNKIIPINSVVEAFAGRSIYSIKDLYSGYDKFQLSLDSRDITTM